MDIKYNKIGTNYNQTRRADPFLTECLFKHLNPKTKGLYLDIGCGTGNYTSALQNKGFDFIGIDPSIKMLAEAKTKNNNIDWKLGSAEATELDTESIEGIIGSLTIHHWTDLKQAFNELYRVLKPTGNLVLFTATPIQMKGYWLNHYFPKMLEDSMRQMPSFESVKKAMELASFSELKTETYNIQPHLEDQFLYFGKHDPELYFNLKIRDGISSFSDLANKQEVKKGLETLRADIDSKHIEKIIDSYKNSHGDYLYIIAKKV